MVLLFWNVLWSPLLPQVRGRGWLVVHGGSVPAERLVSGRGDNSRGGFPVGAGGHVGGDRRERGVREEEVHEED